MLFNKEYLKTYKDIEVREEGDAYRRYTPAVI